MYNDVPLIEQRYPTEVSRDTRIIRFHGRSVTHLGSCNGENNTERNCRRYCVLKC